jgi:peptidoglycan/LPS O-acetylase OafA/YrhL
LVNSNKSIQYFPGLDALRFFAALSVIITHVELLKGAFGRSNWWKEPMIFELGSLGVSFFFVLSGFLITYLLFREDYEFGKINIRKFYLRRIFRIWPLFYLVFLIGFFVLPYFDSINIDYLQTEFESNFWGHFLSYLFILPNLSYSIYGTPVPHIGQSWSIGVEEQFYLVWPLLFYFFRNKIKTFVWLLVCTLLLKSIVLGLSLVVENSIMTSLKAFLAMSKIENMIIGAIGAWIYYNNKTKFLKIIYSSPLVLMSIVSIPLLIYFGPIILQDGYHIIYSISFLIIILNVSTNNRALLDLNHPFFNYLGKISYGIYMYHMMIIPIVIVILNRWLLESWVYNILVYTLSIGMTIVISALSYEYFESKFIALKHKFAKPNR